MKRFALAPLALAGIMLLSGCQTFDPGPLAKLLPTNLGTEKAVGRTGNTERTRSYTARQLLVEKGSLSTKLLLTAVADDENHASKASQASPAGMSPAQAKSMKDAQQIGAWSDQFNALRAGDFSGAGNFAAEKAFKAATDELAKQLTGHQNEQATDHWFKQLVGETQALDKVTVEVPALTSGNGHRINGRLLALARYLAAIKVSKMVLSQAENDLKAARATYVRYQDQVKGLAQEQMQKNFVRKGATHFSGNIPGLTNSETAYLRRYDKKSLAELQALPEWSRIDAILTKTMEASDASKQFSGVKTTRKELVRHYSAYQRTAFGSVSLLAFGVPMGQKAVSLLHSNLDNNETVAVVSMFADAAPELKSALETVSRSLQQNEPLEVGSFILENGGTRKVVSTRELPAALSEADRQQLLSNWVGQPDSHLSRLHVRAADLAAELLDRTIRGELREQLMRAAGFKGDMENASFKDAVKDTKVAYFLNTKVYQAEYPAGDASPAARAQDALRKSAQALHARDIRLMIYSQPNGPWVQAGDTRVLLEQPGLEGLTDWSAYMEAVKNEIVPDFTQVGPQRDGKSKVANRNPAGLTKAAVSVATNAKA